MTKAYVSVPLPMFTLDWERATTAGASAYSGTHPDAAFSYAIHREDDDTYSIYSIEPNGPEFRNNVLSLEDAKHYATEYARSDARYAASVEANAPKPRTLVLVGKLAPRFGATEASIHVKGHRVRVRGQRDALTLALNAIAADYAKAVAS